MIEQLKQKWLSIPTNDRRIYMVLGFIVGLALLYAFIWLPSQQARTRLSTGIQEKKSQLLQMREQANTVKSLQDIVKLNRSNPSNFKASIETSAKLHQMHQHISNIEVNSEGAIHISLPKVNFNEWVNWIAALQNEHLIRIKASDITYVDKAVKIEATLVAD